MSRRTRWRREDDPEYMAEKNRAMRSVNWGCALFFLGVALVGIAVLAIGSFFMGFVPFAGGNETGSTDSTSGLACVLDIHLATIDVHTRYFLSECTLAEWQHSDAWLDVARTWNLEPSQQTDSVQVVGAICALADHAHGPRKLCLEAASELGPRSVQRSNASQP